MMKLLEKWGYKLHDGRRGWVLAMIGTAMLNFAYRENRRLYKQMLIDNGIKAARRV